MKKLITLMALLFSLQYATAQTAIDELKNSMERADGGSGAKVEYLVHLTPTNVKAYYGKDFDSGVLVISGDKPLYFELIKKKGEEKNSIIISVEKSSLIEFEIYYERGECHYKFDFYY
ncbi:MAG: hypothetical protein H6582_05920 [Crocinitomicaceae bacterium]|nr:hypothetical protein [Crocinitomicaceae bacterium]